MKRIHIIKHINNLCRASYQMLFWGLPIIFASLFIMAIKISEEISLGNVGVHLKYTPMLENVIFPLVFLLGVALIVDISTKRGKK